MEDPSISTKKFFDTTMQFLNEEDIQAEIKTQFHTHLISELTNNNNMINPLEFARRSLPHDKVQRYMDKLDENKVTHTTFTKDNGLIKDKIRKVQYEFESGIRILGQQQIVTEKITLHNTEDGKTRVELEDFLTKVVSTR
jgi:hypothetical protein